MKILVVSTCNGRYNNVIKNSKNTESQNLANIQNLYDIYNKPSFGSYWKQFAQNPLGKSAETISFGAKNKTSSREWLSVIENLEKHVENLKEQRENDTALSVNFTKEDEKWLKILKTKLANPNLKIDETNVEAIYDALKVMYYAGTYKPVSVKIGKLNLEVHNRTIADMLKEKYSEKDLSNIRKYLNSHHVFDMTDNPHYGLVVNQERGLVRTCGATENWEMSERAWVTDTMRVGDIQKYKKPETWTQALNTIAAYYDTQQELFAKYIEYPELYYSKNPKEGIPHIFLPATLEPDPDWFNNKRLESHGLALKEFCTAITDGLVKGKKYGYDSFDTIPDNVFTSIDNLSKYFKAIKYFKAPSAGNWEEIPLAGGLTSDTSTIRSALAAFKDLLYNPEYDRNIEIKKVRRNFRKLNAIPEKELNDLIKAGEQRVRATYLQEAPGIREHDSSLAFITTSDTKLADTVMEDVKKHIEILDSLERNLVRQNGIIRYAPFNFPLKDGTMGRSPDSYLNLNYFTAVDKNGKINLNWKKELEEFGSKDCSEPEVFAARAEYSTKDREAQWFMVSEMSTGYGKQIEKLIANARKEQRALNSAEKELVSKLKKKQTEYLNRALARLSDEKPQNISQIKANGNDMPSVTLSEAFQYVTDINGKHKMIQGTNAPLAWALASLYKAINEENKIIKLLDA